MAKFNKKKLPSRHTSLGADRAPHRSFYYAMGETEKDVAKPFSRSGGDCKDEEFMYIFKNNNDSSFEKHQVIPASINDTFRIEKADINKDGTIDLYGFVQGYPNPWMNCKREQLKSVYLNQNGEYFEKTSNNFIKDNFL